MTKEEKKLSLIDLCARLPYGTICEDIYGNSGILFDLTPGLNSVTLKVGELGSTWTTDINKVKPYLRPMYSVTEEEKKIARSFFDYGGYSDLDESIKYIDWLNKNHFDYRGLIPMGLALLAPEGMYN